MGLYVYLLQLFKLAECCIGVPFVGSTTSEQSCLSFIWLWGNLTHRLTAVEVFVSSSQKYLQVLKQKYQQYPGNRDLMAEMFPILMKCTIPYGSNDATIELEHTICSTPRNMANKKIFLFLWFYLAILILASSGHMVYLILQVLMPSLRKR